MSETRQPAPLSATPDDNVAREREPGEDSAGKHSEPAELRFSENGPKLKMPVASQANAVSRVAVVGVPMTIEYWVDDDARYASGSNAPISEKEALIEMVVNKYRGPGKVTVSKDHHLTVLKGGKPNQPYAAKGSTTLTFSEPGEYQIHVTANDLSGPGGGSTGCCWTTGLVKVSVKPAGVAPPTGR